MRKWRGLRVGPSAFGGSGNHGQSMREAGTMLSWNIPPMVNLCDLLFKKCFAGFFRRRLPACLVLCGKSFEQGVLKGVFGFALGRNMTRMCVDDFDCEHSRRSCGGAGI